MLKVDTALLNNYANRLRTIKKKVHNVEINLNKYNSKNDLLSLIGLRYNLLHKYDYYLDSNINYLESSAQEIENVTKRLNQINPLTYKGTAIDKAGAILSNSNLSNLTFPRVTDMQGKIKVGIIEAGFGHSLNFLKTSFESKNVSSLNLKKGDLFLGTEKKGSFSLVNFKSNFNIGNIKNDLDIKVGDVVTKGKLGFTIFKNGKLAPSLTAKGSAEVSALSGKVKSSIGNKDIIEGHTELEGKVLTAKADAELSVGTVVYKDTNGNERTALGVTGKAGFEAYLAKGSIKGGLNIFGIKIEAKAEGGVGGASAELGGSIHTKGLKGTIDLGLGAGAGLDVNVDWSQAKLPNLAKLPKIKLPKLKF